MRPKISGFTIVRDGLKYDYPFIESIHSVLPIVDEMIVAVGKSGDDTRARVEKIDSDKIRIMDTLWNDENRKGGNELARQTNLALEECRCGWAFYLQADEVVHEEDLSAIETAVANYERESKVEALSFRYIHFEANYDYYNPFRYRRQVRLIRTTSDIVSIKDAAEFGHAGGGKLKSKSSGARIYHYGWVKSPKVMLDKSRRFEKFWHSDEYVEEKYAGVDEFDFKMLGVAKRFRGAHPGVMSDRIAERNVQLLHFAAAVRRRPLLLRKMTWQILLRKWGLIKEEWF